MQARGLRSLLLAAAAALSLALAAPLAAADAGATASAAPCSSAKLVVWLPNGAGNGTAGSVYYKLRVTNLGSSPCKLSGFPAVRAIDLKGRVLGKPAQRETNVKAKTVTLSPGSSASFQVRVVEAGNFSPSECHQAQAAGFRVALGGGAHVVPFPFETCAKPTVSALGVGPFQKS